MKEKVAVFIDGAFFEQRFKVKNQRHPDANDVENHVKDLIKGIENSIYTNFEASLIRVYYYDCEPFEGTVKHHKSDKPDIDFSKANLVAVKKEYLRSLKLKPQFALRLGHLSFNGWKVDPFKPQKFKPNFKQKSVDMKIGLDMAWVSSKKTVDRIILVAGDADFITPIKLVRKEGIIVYLDLMGATHVKFELKEHSDFVI